MSQRLHARCACAGASAPFVLAGTQRKYERSRPFVVTHLALDLEVDLAGKAISGTAVLHFTRRSPDARELELDAVGLTLSKVRLDVGKGFAAADHDYDGDTLTLRVPKSVKTGRVEVVYRAEPKRGLYFLAPDAVVKDRPLQAWSQCQDEDARHFFPCQDKPHVKMTTEVTLRVPPGFTALSNGDLVSKETPRGKKPWVHRFAMKDPIPSYLVTVVVGEFDVVNDRAAKRDSGPDVPIAYYVPRGKADDARRAFGETPRMVELFGKLTGVPFPYSRYGQVVVKDFIFGGMENATATTMYEHVLFDARAAEDVTSNDLVAHELAHHWFGDHVTCRDWSHAWLNEGFATYMEHVEREDRLGADEYEYGVRGDMSAYLGEAKGRYQRAIVCRDYEEPIDLFDRHLYEKGGLVLHMLRQELGKELFWTGVNRYLVAHGGGVVETTDLQRALENVSGRSLERFFDQWVFRPGHPELRVQISWDSGHLDVKVKQSQKGNDVGCFHLPIEVEIGTRSGKVIRQEKWTDSESDALVVALSERPAWVTFDPGFRIVGAVTVEAPADMLRSQLAHAKSARGRWLAAESLEKRSDPDTVHALGAALSKKSEAWMVRSECARALGKIRGAEAFGFLERNVDAAHPKVRRAVVSALGSFRTEEAAALLAKRLGKDSSYVVEAEAARALGETRRPRALEKLVAALRTSSWADVVRAGALDGLAALKHDDAVSHVLERTRYGHSSATRRTAVVALAHLSSERRVREHVEDLLDDEDPLFRTAVVRALEYMGEGRARSALRKRMDREPDGRVARRIREALRVLGSGQGSDVRRVNDEVEQLRRDLAELKTRLAKVEHTGKARKKRSAKARAT